MDEKDFSEWFKKKPQIHATGHRPFVHEQEVWWCYLGTNIGSEEDGKGYNISRPALIYRKFNHRTCWVIPLTTTQKENALHIPIDIGDKTKRFALIHHMRSVDTKRLYFYVGTASAECYDTVTSAVTQISSIDWEMKTSKAALDSAALGP
jgi:mRNA interferase MazF